MLKQVHVFVYGDVLGVGFRNWTQMQAKALDVKGWVKNNYAKNCVEALLQADQATLEDLTERLRKGAPASSVDDIEVVWETLTESFEDFSIL